MKRALLIAGMLLAMTGCIYMPVHGDGGKWHVVHQVNPKDQSCDDDAIHHRSYTALVYGDFFREIVCEPIATSRETIKRLQQIADNFNYLDTRRNVFRYDPEERWIPE